MIRALAILILSCVTTPPVVAQSYPAKPIKVIVSTSAVDILAAHELSCRAGLKLVFVPA